MYTVRRVSGVVLLASVGCMLFATRVFVDFEPVRIKAVLRPIPASSSRVEVKTADEKLGTLRTPFALIARIHTDARTPQEIVIHVDGSRVCGATLPARTGRRFDCAVVRDWTPRSDHDLSFTGTGEPFTLEYLELATHHGHTTGVFKAVVLPAASRRYGAASVFWLGAVWAALAILLWLEPRPFESRTAKSILRVLAAVIMALVTLVLLSPILSPYLVVISPSTFATMVLLATLSRTWPIVVGCSARVVTAARAAAVGARDVLGKAIRAARTIWTWSGVHHGRLVWTMAVALSAAGIICGPRAVGGSDEYGYVSQAELWLNGNLKIEQPFARQAPWREAEWSFAPLGYRPHPLERGVIVPVYSPGFPLLLALAKLVGGQDAMYFVVPLSAGLLVLGTYSIGQRLGARTAGLIGALLVATSPVVLFMTTATMTDVPVAAAWAWAFSLLLGPTVRTAAWAGLLSALAVLIRPNLTPLAGVLALHYIFTMRHAEVRGRALGQLLAFAAGLMPGVAAIAIINAHLHGSPFTSGYGTTSELFWWSRVPTNLGLYLDWFAQVHTPFALCGLAAVLVPIRRLWPTVRDRSVLIVIATFVVGVWLIYCAWVVFDVWWFSRFLLSSWPFIMLGVGSVAVAAYRFSARYVRPVVVAAVIALAIFQLDTAIAHGTFDMADGRRRFVAVARLVRRMTDRNSVIVSLDYSGSIRYYGGRMTINYGGIPRGQSLDAIVDWLTAHGVRTYLAVEDGELQEIVQRFAGSACLRALEGPPVAIYEKPGKMLLYDLTEQRSPDEMPAIEIDVDIGPTALPVPTPRLVFKDAS